MHTILNWLDANKEWLFSGVGVAAAAWTVGMIIRRAKAKPALTNEQQIKAAVAAGSLTNSPVAVGSHITQNVTLQRPGGPLQSIIPISQRHPSSPTPDEIWQQRDRTPPFQRPRFLNNYAGLPARWPARFFQIINDSPPLFLLVLRYNNLPQVLCRVNIDEYPIIRVLHEGAWVWVEGTIEEVDETGEILVKPTKLEFE